jgi:hypothetical protein
MIKRKLSKAAVKKEDFQIWNAFIDLLSIESEDDLTDRQKIAQRAFRYDAEVQNGGHFQYFENQDRKNYDDVIQAMKAIGAVKHAKILDFASRLYLSKKGNVVKKLFGFMKTVERELDALDHKYVEIDPDVNYYLREYLNKYQDEFVEIE